MNEIPKEKDYLEKLPMPNLHILVLLILNKDLLFHIQDSDLIKGELERVGKGIKLNELGGQIKYLEVEEPFDKANLMEW